MSESAQAKIQSQHGGPPVLFVDDDRYATRRYVEALMDAGFEVICAIDAEEAMDAVEHYSFVAAIIDVMIPPGPELDPLETRGGFRTGLALARQLRTRLPDLKILGISNTEEDDIKNWFEAQKSMAYSSKVSLFPSTLVDRLNQLLHRANRLPSIFIVHGRDWQTALELKNFIQNGLHLGEPLFLVEQPSMGRTIIEKFEHYAQQIDLVFVLLTPDDLGHLADSSRAHSRARQNVIFELGYFAGLLGRKSGKLIVLLKGSTEIPSDVSGLVYIDISNGINAAAEVIRRELVAWL